MTKSVYIIYNPRSGRPRERQIAVEHFSALLRARGFTVEAAATQSPNHATVLARQAVGQVDLIIANGGDGTLNEVLQGMVGSATPLAIWPGGTANVLALDLKLPREPEKIIDLIMYGEQQRICVGRAGERYFFFTAGIGLDAEIINAVNKELKKHLGKGAFWIAGFAHLVKWQPTPITLKTDDQVHQGTFAVIGNSYGYGGTFSLTPHARLNEDLLDVCLFAGTSKLQYINYLVACLSRQQLTQEGVSYFKTRCVEVTAPLPLPVQVDGEVIGNLPMTFEAVPNALTLIVPEGVFAK